MIRIGTKVAFIPWHRHHGGSKRGLRSIVGVVDYINYDNLWFRVKYAVGEAVYHECFKDSQIGGDAVIVN